MKLKSFKDFQVSENFQYHLDNGIGLSDSVFRLGSDAFNKLFEDRIDPADKKIIDVLEATQFIRMLPFKCAAGETEKAMFFYVHACHLLSKVFK